ncbi:MAG: hypothetical protein RIM33_03010 [Alphaproteobacteria bacterium]
MALKVSGGSGDDVATGPRQVEIRDRYIVNSDKPLPQFDSQPAMGFECNHKRDSKRNLYALICDPKLPPRLEVVSMLRRIDHRNLLRALDWEIVNWAPEGRRCPAIVLERPGGGKVFPTLGANLAPMQEELVTRYFIEPVCQILGGMHGIGLYHRMIRPDNLYWMSAEQREMLIGECCSSQPGMTNSVVYETLECSLASAAGRGEGGSENDLYAVGVTILALLTGISPLYGVPDEQVVQQKLVQGSYGALAQNHRISLTMMEPLRGLLNDDPDERWTLEELSLWLNGRRLSPKQQVMPTKASRGLTVAGKDYNTCREVAYAMQRNWEQAGPLIASGALDTWLRRSLGEDDRVEAVNLAKSGSSDNQDKLIARVLIALDPNGPIRLKSYSATIEGIASLLGAFPKEAEARQLFSSILTMGLINFWMDQRRGLDPTIVRHMTRLEKVKSIMNQTGLGFGIERAVYELNQGVPCLSDMFERDYVPAVEYILPAIERACAVEDPPERLIDRDVAAYLGTHFKRPIGGELRDIDRDPDGDEGLIAQIKILSMLQEANHRNIPMINVSRVCAIRLGGSIERFHSRDRRKKVRGRLRKSAESGILSDLLEIFDDQEELAADRNGFNGATAEYHRTTINLIAVYRDMHNRPALATEYGGQLASAAALLSCVATVALAGFAAFF